MATIEEATQRIDSLEREQRRKWRFFVQYLISPIILVVIGYVLNQDVEQAKQEFQSLELDVKKIEAAQNMLTELFSDVPERAFIAERLMSKLVDKALADEISEVVTLYYSQKLASSDISKEDVEKITTAAATIGGRAAESIMQNPYYVIVASIRPEEQERAIELAKSLMAKGYKSEVHLSSSGYLGVAAGHLPLNEAKNLRFQLIKNNDGPDDTYLTPGIRFTKMIYPE